MSDAPTGVRELTFSANYGPTSDATIKVRVTGDSITFGQALALATRELGVDSSATGKVNGNDADTSTRVKDGDRVDFTNKPQGDKG